MRRGLTGWRGQLLASLARESSSVGVQLIAAGAGGDDPKPEAARSSLPPVSVASGKSDTTVVPSQSDHVWLTGGEAEVLLRLFGYRLAADCLVASSKHHGGTSDRSGFFDFDDLLRALAKRTMITSRSDAVLTDYQAYQD